MRNSKCIFFQGEFYTYHWNQYSRISFARYSGTKRIYATFYTIFWVANAIPFFSPFNMQNWTIGCYLNTNPCFWNPALVLIWTQLYLYMVHLSDIHRCFDGIAIFLGLTSRPEKNVVVRTQLLAVMALDISVPLSWVDNWYHILVLTLSCYISEPFQVSW